MDVFNIAMQLYTYYNQYNVFYYNFNLTKLLSVYKFFVKKTSMFTLSGFRQDLRGDIMFPDVLNRQQCLLHKHRDTFLLN